MMWNTMKLCGYISLFTHSLAEGEIVFDYKQNKLLLQHFT